MPQALMSLGSKMTPQGAPGGNSYDYEYYDADTGASLPPLSPQTFTQYPAVPPPSTIYQPTQTFSSPISFQQQPQQYSPSFLPATQPRSTLPSSTISFPPATLNAPKPAGASPVAQGDKEKAAGLLSAIGGQKTLTEAYDAMGGQQGIEAIYNSLGGRDAVMKMIQSGQGLPANFKLPSQLTDLKKKIDDAADKQKPPKTGGDDYDYYYVDENDVEIPGSSSSIPSHPSVAPVPVAQVGLRVSSPVAPAAPLFAPPNPSVVAGGGSLFDFLDNDDEVTLPKKTVSSPTTSTTRLPAATEYKPLTDPSALYTPRSIPPVSPVITPASSIPSPSVAAKGKKAVTTTTTPAAPALSLADRLAAAQSRSIGGR
jgi:hypothetical protein